ELPAVLDADPPCDLRAADVRAEEYVGRDLPRYRVRLGKRFVQDSRPLAADHHSYAELLRGLGEVPVYGLRELRAAGHRADHQRSREPAAQEGGRRIYVVKV